jgi:hypothetical protein
MVSAVIAISLVFVGTVFAAQAHQNTGCGLGTLLFKSNADNSTLLQTLQSWTNGIFFNQSFGITFGTSECKQPRNFVNNERASEFAAANMDNLARDIAQGRGETLDAFAELMGVPAKKRPEFYQQLQSGFTRIFTSPGVQMASVMDNISTVAK